MTQGVGGTPISLSARSGYSLSGRCAEWIVEAAGSLGLLASNSGVLFQGCAAGTAAGQTLDVAAADTINMTSGDGQTISTGSIAGPSDVRVAYA